MNINMFLWDYVGTIQKINTRVSLALGSPGQLVRILNQVHPNLGFIKGLFEIGNKSNSISNVKYDINEIDSIKGRNKYKQDCMVGCLQVLPYQFYCKVTHPKLGLF